MSNKTSRRPVPRAPARKQPETLRLASAAPSFTVSDIQRSLAWYRDILGFSEVDRWEQDGHLAGVELKAGTVVFILNQDDFAKGRDRIKGVGFRLYCRTRQDVDRLAATIKARGGVLAREPTTRSWGTRDFALVDPDGFNLTITSTA
ncbi:MAG: VOC family protein [Gemmatimonadetes bacterium]|nr:VOC family protein [Gemmatimonadota bacterium]